MASDPAGAPPGASSFDELLARNRDYARRSFGGLLPLRPRRKLAIVACMDSRMPVFRILGLEPGEAHIVRNAGGVITDDVIRSLVLSQRLMGTEEILLIHHTDCGLTKISEDALRASLEAETGMRPCRAPVDPPPVALALPPAPRPDPRLRLRRGERAHGSGRGRGRTRGRVTRRERGSPWSLERRRSIMGAWHCSRSPRSRCSYRRKPRPAPRRPSCPA
jgi:carbonic anhydrase